MKGAAIVAALVATAGALALPSISGVSPSDLSTITTGVSAATTTQPGAPLTISKPQGPGPAAPTPTPTLLTDSKVSSAIVTASMMKPGDSATGTVTITAQQITAVSLFEKDLTHSGPVNSGNLAHDLSLTVLDQTTGTTVYSGPFDAIPASPGMPVCGSTSKPGQCLSWNIGEAHTFAFTVLFPESGSLAPPGLPSHPPASPNSDNKYQGTNASTTFVWGASGLSTSCAGAKHNGNNIEVPGGVTCILVDSPVGGNAVVDPKGNLQIYGGSVGGDVQSNGGALTLGTDGLGKGPKIGGNVQAQAGGTITIASAAIHGDLQINGVGAKGVTDTVCASSIGGNLQAQSNTGTLVIGDLSKCTGGNTVGGNTQVQSNTGPPPASSVVISNNTVSGNLQCTSDTPVATGVAESNRVHKNIQGECVPLAVHF